MRELSSRKSRQITVEVFEVEEITNIILIEDSCIESIGRVA